MQSSVLLVSYQCFYTWKPSVDQALCLPNLWPRHLCSLLREVSYVLQGHSLLKKKPFVNQYDHTTEIVCVCLCVWAGVGVWLVGSMTSLVEVVTGLLGE